jgi:hypothetical protein
MDTLPSPVRRLVEGWTLEFERADAHARLEAIWAHEAHRAAMRHICEDVRMNPPTYVFDILTRHGAHIQMPLALPDCDPQRVRTGLRLPESHIATWRRRIRAVWIGHALFAAPE